MSTSNPSATPPTPPTGTAAGANTYPFLNVTGNINCQALNTRAPLQIQQGGHLLSGKGAPSNAQGVNGDAYLRTDGTTSTTHLYYKASGSWSGIA